MWKVIYEKAKPWIGWAIATSAILAASYFFGFNVPLPKPPAFGWVEDRQAVAAIVAQQPFATFSDTPAYMEADDDDDDILLFNAPLKAIGRQIPGRNQGQVGSCVSFGYAAGVEYLVAGQIANGAPIEWRDVTQEAIYGLARVEIGGGKIKGDGAVGAWAAQAVKQYGVIARGHIGGHDLTSYSESRCREWGASGLPDPLEPIAKMSPVQGVALVTSAEACRKALKSGYPVPVCSSQGFSQLRDSDGFCKPQGQWMHCMCIVGYQGGARRGFFIVNSWGDQFFSGPAGKGNPPPSGFWAEYNVVDKMLRQGDSWALSDAKGFPKRKIDWTVWNHAEPDHRASRVAVVKSPVARTPSRALEVFNTRGFPCDSLSWSAFFLLPS
jgi:hypothetical protein